jgi:hypothetical protein
MQKANEEAVFNLLLWIKQGNSRLKVTYATAAGITDQERALNELVGG